MVLMRYLNGPNEVFQKVSVLMHPIILLKVFPRVLVILIDNIFEGISNGISRA